MKIFAFIVTYNRLNLLKRVVESLRSQTRKIDRIVVVNNSSTDGTREWLQTQTDLTVIHQENLGGAGGFYRGTKYCYENGADWVWMMDDDVFPNADCLEKLLECTSVSECLNIDRYYSGGEIVKCPNWYYQPSSHSHPLYDAATESQYLTASEGGCFEGMLISRALIEKIGYPDPAFFVCGDDTVYGYMAMKYTRPVFVRKATASRAQRSDDRALRPLSTYYATRNRHLLKKYIRQGVGDIALPSAWNYYLIYPIAKTFQLLLSDHKNKYKELRAYYWGIIDNLRKLSGPSHNRHKF